MSVTVWSAGASLSVNTIIAPTEISEGAHLVNPSVALRDPVAIISPAMATANNKYAWVKVIISYTF